MSKINKGVVLGSALGGALVLPEIAKADAVAAINSAITQGETIVGLVGPGVIGIAALMLGVGLVVSWLRK